MELSLERILAITNKPGLYKLVTQTRSGLVAESLVDGKRIAVSLRNNLSLLSEIAIYTLSEDLPLKEVFKKIREKEDAKPTAISHKSSKDDIEEYFFTVLPDYDEDRVYASDIKKVMRWYNILQENDLLHILDETSDEEE